MAQARNIIISTDAYRSKYKGLHSEKTINCFCSLQIWKDLDKKFKLCDSHMSSSGHLSF